MATVPVWPPASVPWATTKSQPLATALTAWRTLPHIEPTRMFAACSASTASRGTPSPATKIRAPPSITARMPSSTWPGIAVSRSTPNGFVGQGAHPGHLVGEAGAHGRRAERADAAGLADGGDELVVRHAAHAGEHDGVLDVEQFGEPGAHARERSDAPPAAVTRRASTGCLLPSVVLSASPRRRRPATRRARRGGRRAAGPPGPARRGPPTARRTDRAAAPPSCARRRSARRR